MADDRGGSATGSRPLKIVLLSEPISVSPQIGVDDIGKAAALGFKTIVSNRPDGEEEGQPRAEEIAAAAARHGMDFAFVPVTPGQIADADVAAYRRVTAGARPPILAYCRTGTRSAGLWALAEAPKRSPEQILRIAAAAGYDLSTLLPRLERHAT